MKRATSLVQYEAAPGDPARPNSTPIHQTATFAQPGALEFGSYDYSRSANPSRTVLEEQLARLEHGVRGLAYGSGMAAINAAMRLAGQGDRVLAGGDLYGGTMRLLGRSLPRQGVTVDFVDTTDLDAVRVALHRGTKLLFVETPSNPRHEVSDLAALAELAHAADALFVVDNTMLSPWLQNPLTLGADVVIHSATKHLGGHGDLTAGAIICAEAEVGEELAFTQNAEGTALGPFDSWLLLRGMMTLSVRLERAQAGAVRLAEWLHGRSEIRRVHYAGLADHPSYALQSRQARGAGSVLAFETEDLELSRQFVEALKLFSISVSFGSVSSSISMPCHMSHASIPAELRASHAPPVDLVRISVGIEDAGDLIRDMQQAFEKCAARQPCAR